MSELKFLDSYFEDEVRDGFFVPSEMKRAWAAEMEVLSEVDRVCRKHNIQYFADWGTLLAAVRHEGYIPWDDDLDIVMKRKDYERFMKIAGKELPDGFSAYNFHNHDDFWLFLGRVVGKQRICFEEEHLQRFHQFPYIAGVDIFVLDYVCRDEEREQERNKLAMSVLAVADGIGENQYERSHIDLLLSKVENEVHVKINHQLDRDTLRRELYGVVEQLFAKFSEDEADELTQLYPFGLKNKEFRFPKECYERAVRIPYENMTVPVPELYEKVLIRRYGEYMNLVRNVGGHDYPFFSLQHKQLQSVLDFELPKYKFESKLLNLRIGGSISGEQIPCSCTDDMQGKESFKSVVSQYCDAIKEEAGTIISLSDLQQEDKVEELQASCEEMQQLAIDLGGFIEQFRGEGFITVSYLEELCNAIYTVFESQGEKDSVAHMADVCSQVCESAISDIISRKEVVFLPDHPKHWGGFEDIYRAAQKDPFTDVYVVPIPYYYKNYDGSVHDMQYHIEDYPDDVKITSYEEYEFELCRPDTIFIQNPYDEWNVALTVPDFFYSRNLLRFTDQLVYVPWFRLEEFTPDNFREYYNMKYYCTVPGVVNADKVIVQSDNMRTNYIEKLTKWSGERARAVWEEKIVSAESIGEQEEKKDSDGIQQYSDENQKEENDNPVSRKSIVFYIQLSSFLEYKEKMIEKLQYIFDIFKESEVSGIWVMDVNAERDLERIEPEIYCEYLKKKEYYEKYVGSFVLRSEINSCKELVEKADAYYGDRGRIALDFMEAKKPVMIQDVSIV